MDDQRSSPSSILLAVSDSGLRQKLATSLRAEGYQVMTASNGDQTLEMASLYSLSLVLLDFTLPQQDGLEVCRQLRSNYNTAYLPIMLLTSHPDDIEMIVGLEVGADDYVTTPVQWSVIRARIRALLRRSQYNRQRSQPLEDTHVVTTHEGDQAQMLVVGDLCIDRAGRTVLFNGQSVDLSVRLFDLLVSFATHLDVVLTRRELIRQLHLDVKNGERLLDGYVHWLREKLEENQAYSQRIQTVRGVGYRFVSEKQADARQG